MKIKKVNAAYAAYLRETIGRGNFKVSLKVLTASSEMDRKAVQAMMANVIRPLVLSAREVSIFGAKFGDNDFYGDGKKLLGIVKFSRGSAKVPLAARSDFCELINFWSNRTKREVGLNVWRGDIAALVDLDKFEYKKLFMAAINPKVISNYKVGLASGAVRLLDKSAEYSRGKVLVLFPGSNAMESVVLSSGKRVIQELVNSAIENCESNIELYNESIPADQLVAKVADALQSAKEILARHKGGT